MHGRVLVTGGSGFIGTNLVSALLETSTPVLNLDVRAPLCASHRDVHRSGDVGDWNTVLDVFGKFDPTTVIHLAARTEAEPAAASNDYDVNVRGTQTLLRALASATNAKTALFTSSVVVAWPGSANHTSYAESKTRMEETVGAAANMGCACCIVRPVSTWGPYFGTPFKPFFEAIARGRYWHPGPANAPKRFGYVGNTVYQLLRLLEIEPAQVHRKLFFLGDYEPFTIARWADLISRKFHVKPPRTLPGWLVNVAAKAGDLLQASGMQQAPITSRRLNNMRTDTSVFPIDEIRSIAGPLPYSLEDGVEQTVHWLRSNRK